MATSIEFAASSPSPVFDLKKKERDEINGTKGKIQFTRNRVTALEAINLPSLPFPSTLLFHFMAILCYDVFMLASQRINGNKDTS